MTIHTVDPVTVTGAGGGLGQAVVKRLGSWVIPMHRSDPLTFPDASLGLVCCHAAPVGSTLEEMLRVDVGLTMAAIEARVPYMRVIGRGSIVLISSIRAHAPRPGQAYYAASKGAIEALTRALAVDLAPHNITVNCIAPGALLTPRTIENINRGIVRQEELVGPSGKMATVEDVADVVDWLLYTSPPTFTGQVVTIDAGWSVAG